jgi:hypothetical protein
VAGDSIRARGRLPIVTLASGTRITFVMRDS